MRPIPKKPTSSSGCARLPAHGRERQCARATPKPTIRLASIPRTKSAAFCSCRSRRCIVRRDTERHALSDQGGTRSGRQGPAVFFRDRAVAGDQRIRTVDDFTRRYFFLLPAMIALAGLLGWVLAGRAHPAAELRGAGGAEHHRVESVAADSAARRGRRTGSPDRQLQPHDRAPEPILRTDPPLLDRRFA